MHFSNHYFSIKLKTLVCKTEKFYVLRKSQRNYKKSDYMFLYIIITMQFMFLPTLIYYKLLHVAYFVKNSDLTLRT